MNRLTVAAAGIICLTLTGCLSPGPKYQDPRTDIKIPAAYKEAGKAAAARFVEQDQWWEAFDDARLNQVVDNVIRGNPDARKAAASVMEARSLMEQSRANRFPVLDFKANAARQEQSVFSPLNGENITVKSDSFSLTLPASFEIDLWGRLSKASEAARADLLAAEENRRTIVQSLVAEAVSQYFHIQSLEARLRLTRQLRKAHQDTLELLEARYEQGLTSILELRQARRSLARSEAQLPPLVQAAGKARQALAVLQGQYPDRQSVRTTPENGFELPAPIPGGLPSELLNRRPDIRAAESALKAACARIGVARANRFPQMNLTASFGYTSEALSALFEPENQLWQMAAGLFQPVFDAGKRKAAQRAAEARYEQQLAAYAKTVLGAFAEVEGALLTRQQQLERYDRLMVYAEEADATLETALDRYQRGLNDYLYVLDARMAMFQAELELVETRNTIYTNRVGLYRALGGGWGESPEGRTAE